LEIVVPEVHSNTTPDDLTVRDEDPAGGVTIPANRREIARAYALAGISLGLSAIYGVFATADTSSITFYN